MKYIFGAFALLWFHILALFIIAFAILFNLFYILWNLELVKNDSYYNLSGLFSLNDYKNAVKEVFTDAIETKIKIKT